MLPDRIAATAGDYGIHPALLDAGLHLFRRLVRQTRRLPEGAGEVLLPFAWSDVALQATGASELRICMTLDTTDGAEAIATLDLFDVSQRRVARVGELRPPSGDA